MEEQSNKQDYKKGTWWDQYSIWVLIVSLLVFVVGFWFGSLFYLVDASTPSVPYDGNEIFKKIGDRGTFGDMFGSVNALFSGLAFVGLICTLLVKMKELKAQREELSMTRCVMNDQKKIMDEQRDQISIQNFESGFFQVLKMHTGTIEELMLELPRGRAYEGNSCFLQYSEIIYNKFSASKYPKDTLMKKVEVLKHSIDRANYDLRVPFFLYIMSVLSLFSYIENSDIEKTGPVNHSV